MDAAPFVKAANDMGARFIGLLDTLSAVSEVTGIDVRQQDTGDLLGQALQSLVRHQDLECCSVFLREDDRLVLHAFADFASVLGEGGEAPPRPPEPVSIALGEGLVGRAAATGEPQYDPHCAAAAAAPPAACPASSAPASVLCMPITNGTAVLGVTCIQHPERDHFGHEHHQVLALFCSILGHLLASHRVVRRMEEAVEQRTRQLETALREAEDLRRRYQELSSVDELTGLHNRRFFFPEAEAAIARALRHHESFCLLVIDLDCFKEVNDDYGHAAGDTVLRGVADALRHYTREGDILARTGGEEFVLALPHTSQSGASILAERIRQRVESLRWPALGDDVKVTASLGLASLDTTARGDARTALERLIRHGDQAMYRCKRQGRNRVAAY